ncbi:hypothetical protein CERZMDRAFT_34741 [Cercospora zeae-maydis SCOH1-5]|uniref:Uncharacterized protein n=1 Tax=Cercospora zeae-maydis SCOH1-5 TaxID=717836 RepID=A0A6A6FQF9_9PEZI|nr:hypothetical protein CERZMDRAFT_34741 [Cercospora zeae-maydis SCOH1-5]
MATLRTAVRPALSFQSLRVVARTSPNTLRRALSTLPNNEHIYIHDVPNAPKKQYLLSYLPNEPPIASLAIGTTTQVPPTANSLQENPEFLQILHWVIKDNAANDPDVQAQAAMYASSAGSSLGSGGTGGDGAGGASAQGGMGGAGRGGYIHVSDQRYPPDFGRVAYPEDIFGSLELDSRGNFVDGTGRYQAGNTYRIVTNEGILGLSAYLRERLIDKLREMDTQARRNP